LNDNRHRDIGLRYLVSIEELELTGCKVHNYHHLPNLKKASFSKDADLTCFRDLSSLSLKAMHGIAGVSSLREIPTLSFTVEAFPMYLHWARSTPCVEDISALGSVYDLHLRDFQGNIPLYLFMNVIVLDLSGSESISEIGCLGHSSVRELNLADCIHISDITMLKNVKKLDISNCPLINNLSGLKALTDFTAQTTGESLNFQSAGLESVRGLRSLDSICVEAFFVELAKAPLKDLSIQLWCTSDIESELKKLTQLQHLQIFFCEGEKVVIPEIASLGNVVMYKCDEVSQIVVEPPTTEIKQIREFPIYEMLVAECHELEEMSISRPISLLKIKNDSPCRRINCRELVKEIQESHIPRDAT
jgi:hypothetical protein